MKDINIKINEAVNGITGIKSATWFISINDVNYLGLSQDKAWKSTTFPIVKIITKKTKVEDFIKMITNEYSLENGYCLTLLRKIEHENGSRWELGTGLPAVTAWSTKDNEFKYEYFVDGKWKEGKPSHDSLEKYFKQFTSKYYGPMAVVKIDDMKNLPNNI